MPRIGKYWLSLDLYHWLHDTAHTWAKLEPENKVRVGVDDFAQKQAGELLFIRLFPIGKEVKQGARFGTLETAKWVGPLLSPLSGKIVEINNEVLKSPKVVNKDPYEKGRMIVITPTELEEDLSCLVKGDAAIEWLKKDIRKIAKRDITCIQPSL